MGAPRPLVAEPGSFQGLSAEEIIASVLVMEEEPKARALLPEFPTATGYEVLATSRS